MEAPFVAGKLLAVAQSFIKKIQILRYIQDNDPNHTSYIAKETYEELSIN